MKKFLLLFYFFLILAGSSAFGQRNLALKAAFGWVQAGNGDLPGSQFFLGGQKQFSQLVGLEVLLSGTYIQGLSNYGGLNIYEQSNGIGLETLFDFYIKVKRFTFYPAAGAVLRYAHEIRAQNLTIWSGQSGIMDYEYELKDEKEWQPGYVVALNLDGRIRKGFSLGVRGSVQKYFNGQQLSFIGLSVKYDGWD